jgi:hypothetical protein
MHLPALTKINCCKLNILTKTKNKNTLVRTPQSRNTLYLSLAHSFSPGPCTPTQAPLNHSSDRFSGGGDRAWTALRGFNHANTTALAGLEIGNNM